MYRPFPIERFGGLRLDLSPEEAGYSFAVNADNVDLRRPGRIATRWGFEAFSDTNRDYRFIHHHVTFSGSHKILAAWDASGTTTLGALDGNGVTGTTTTATGGAWNVTAVNFGTDTTSKIYIAIAGQSYKTYDAAAGTPFGTATDPPAGKPFYLTVQPSDNRLVSAGFSSKPYRVHFSDPGAPDTWGANNWVDLEPGDGEKIGGLATWNGLVFAFKRTKFYVFYGNGTDESGQPVFNYRAVSAGRGIRASSSSTTLMRACVSAPQGVYMLATEGVYLTTGGDPVKVSDALDPLFHGTLNEYIPGFDFSTLLASTSFFGLTYAKGYLMLAFAPGAGTDIAGRTLVFDTQVGQWLTWSFDTSWSPGLSMIMEMPSSGGLGGTSDLIALQIHPFTADSGRALLRMPNNGRLTTDAGNPLTATYRFGFYTVGNQASQEASIRETLIDGTGSVDFSVSKDFEEDIPLSGGGAEDTVDLGFDTAETGRHRIAQRGRRFSPNITGQAPWTVDSLTHHVLGVRPPGEQSVREAA